MTAKTFFHKVVRNPQIFIYAPLPPAGYSIRALIENSFNWGDFLFMTVLGVGVNVFSVLFAWGLVTTIEVYKKKKNEVS